MKLIFTVVLFNIICLNLKAQQDTTYNPNHLYQPQELRADLAFLKSVLEEAHPSLYRYTPKGTIDLKFENADKQLNKPLTDKEFWKVAAPCVAAIRSGHTALYLSSAYVSWQNKNPITVLPLSVYLMNDKVYAAGFPSKTKNLYRGAEILSIDGHPVKEILSTIKPMVAPEGNSDQFVDFMLEARMFSYLYGDFFGSRPQYAVAYLDSTGKKQEVLVDGVKSGAMVSIEHSKEMLEQEWNELDKSVKIEYFDSLPGTVSLKIKGLTYYNYYKSFDAGFFELMQKDKIKNIIIDLRGNGGGYLGIGTDMMRYLINGSVEPMREVTATEKENSFGKYVIKEGSDFSKAFLLKSGKREYSIYNVNHPIYAYPEYHYGNNVYVLIDKGTFSAASLFVANLKSQRKIKILGEETGGGEAGTDAYGFTIVQLPTTHLLLRLPNFWGATTTKHKNTGHGVMPDIEIKPTITDRVNKNDVVMKETLKLIMTKNNSK
ncbi:S41 family peptidase [Mucilaginibacter jinjuensis]|uniref:S41 family peptidase n=1 Tax=Mucilaginibacter jinjuensis TaxID=1176721 RepID=A0ABY7T947_9SPHI|nr:S41 family peptidase [Mucilaginibacter jinjuensis]WCT12263.1 S41 family peptidase [Mucilaginibacter jinjuensis]